jgi:protein-disulfide isomerase
MTNITQGRRPLVLFAALCVLGLAASIELTRIHYFTHTDPEFHSVCAVTDSVNCETVALSPYSVFAGLPVSVWGILGYLAMAAFAAWGVSRPRPHRLWPLGIMTALASVSLLVSLVLAGVSFVYIDSLCVYCTASYVINVMLVILCALALRRAHAGPVSALRADIRTLTSRPVLSGILVVLALLAPNGIKMVVKPYWDTLDWAAVPRLPHGVDADGRHWIGAEHPRVTIVEFSDYECPHCKRAHQIMRTLAADHRDEVRFIHRHLPLDRACHPLMKRDFHLHACRFARAAECAGAQDRFWEMNDALFSVQNSTRAEDVDVENLAVRLGLDRSAFAACMESHEAEARVRADLDAAIALGLRGTPTYVVGEAVYLGMIPKAELEAIVEDRGPTASSVGDGVLTRE